MPCFFPLQVFYKSRDPVEIGFLSSTPLSLLEKVLDSDKFTLPCGRCIGCRLEYSRQWALRCMHEASLFERNCFITLTYSPEYLPAGATLVPRDFQLFMKRLRKRFGPDIRFYCCGEYGSKFGRPHYHACLFNFDFDDKKFFRRVGKKRSILYVSSSLSSLWPYGFSTLGSLTIDSAAYVARYVLKKTMNSDRKAEYVDPLTGAISYRHPEFSRMSLRPAVGRDWYERFKSDVYPSDFVVMNGKKVRPPRYYDSLLKKSDPSLFLDIKSKREDSLFDVDPLELTSCRLFVKEKVCRSRINNLIRSVDQEIL